MAEFYSDFQMCEQCGTAICNASCRNSGTPNCRSSLFALGQYFFDAKEYSLAIPYLERVADRFRPAACKLIGDCYAKGLGIAVDINKAQEFYRLGTLMFIMVTLSLQWPMMDLFLGSKRRTRM